MNEYTLDSIIKEYLIETGESSLNKYARYYQLAVSFLRESNMNQSGIPKVVQIDISANDTVNLPLDFLEYNKIGVADRFGNIHSLAQNDNISLLETFNDCGEPTRIKSQPQGIAYRNDNNWRNGECMGRFFGIGGGNSAYGNYKVDYKNGIIVLSNMTNISQSIVLEYLADITSIDKDFKVHPFIVETLKAWIYWKTIQRDAKRSANDKEIARRDFYVAQKWSGKRFSKSTIKEWVQGFRSGNVASPKW